ncbi:MAG: hypothetical protein C0594_01160, partial [Marinilabiliales bacterium]
MQTKQDIFSQDLVKKNELLEAIYLMQNHYIKNGMSYGWCEESLKSLLQLTNSEFGFICELLYRQDGTPFIKSHIITNIAWSDETRKFYKQNKEKGLEFDNFNSIWGQVFKTGKPYISDEPDTDKNRGGYPKNSGHPSLKKFLGLPIKGNDEKIIGIMAVANNPNGYNSETIDFIEPFVSTYGILLERERQNAELFKTKEELINKNKEYEAINGEYEAVNEELRQANEELNASKEKTEESELRLDAIINGSPFPIAVVDTLDENILYWSRSALERFGYAPKIVSEWYNLAYPDTEYRKKVIEQWKPFFEKAQETGKTINAGEYEITCKDGSVKICELHIQSIPDSIIISFNEITERKKAEAEIRNNKIELQTWIQNSPICTKKVDKNFNLQFMSESGVKELKVGDVNKFYNAPYPFYFFPEPFKKLMSSKLKEVKESGEIVQIDGILSDIEGNKMWYNHMLVPVKNEKGKYSYTLVLSTDITQRKKAEIDLRNSLNRFSALVEHLQSGVFYINTKGEILEMNPAMVKILGSPSKEKTQEINVFKFQPLIDIGYTGKLKQCIENKEIVSGEVKYVSKWNKTAIVNFYFVPIIENDDVVGVLASNEDYTEQRAAEEALRRSEQRLKLSTQSANLGVWDWNVKENSMVWDDRMFELYGVKKENFVKTLDAWTNGLHPEDKERAIMECNEALEGNSNFDTTFRVLHPNGKLLHIKADALVLRDSKGKAERMIGVNRDITENKQNETKLKLAKEKAEENDRLKTEFINNMSHEIRTPMNGIMGFTSLLNKENISDDKRKHYVNIIQNSGQQLMR